MYSLAKNNRELSGLYKCQIRGNAAKKREELCVIGWGIR